MTLFVAFDLETTGLNVVRDNFVTAAVVGHPDFNTDILVAPRVPISPEAQAVHGITDLYAMQKGMRYADGLDALGSALRGAWEAGAVIAGHNILNFDLPMLRMQERIVFGEVRTEFRPIFDTYVEYKAAFPK